MLYKKLYKNISVVALGTALFSLPVFTACESDVVDLEPVDKFSELTAYGTEERCELAVVGAYDAAQCGMYVDPNDFIVLFPKRSLEIIGFFRLFK